MAIIRNGVRIPSARTKIANNTMSRKENPVSKPANKSNTKALNPIEKRTTLKGKGNSNTTIYKRKGEKWWFVREAGKEVQVFDDQASAMRYCAKLGLIKDSIVTGMYDKRTSEKTNSKPTGIEVR